MTDTHIKINAVTPKVQYTGNGSTTVFPYEFPIFSDSDMVVYVDDDIIETGYTVSGAGQTEGGNVTFSTAPADGKKITLLRNVPIERVTDFQEGGTFRPKNINDEFDRQTAFAQQVQEGLSRAVKVGVTSEIDPDQVVKEIEEVYENLDEIKNAKTWAEGSDADVALIGGTHSAKGWANQEADNHLVKATGTSTSRALKDRFVDNLNVKDYGAKGDGTTDDTAAVRAMIADVGYARIPRGVFNCNTGTTAFDAQFFFDAGGALTCDSGKQIRITDAINSPKQYIFQGAGTYKLIHDSDSGENARQIHISWFGVFPDCIEYTDQSAKIQKAIDSFGGIREGTIEFDVGNYCLGNTVTVSRAVRIIGQGIRRTVFRRLTDGWTAFKTGEVGIRFQDVQFEPLNTSMYQNSPWIEIDHTNCDIIDCSFFNGFQGIIVNANNATLKNIRYVYTGDYGTGSSLIQVKKSYCYIDNVSGYSQSTHGVEALIRVSDNADALESTIIKNVTCFIPFTSVLVVGDGTAITGVSIDGVVCNKGPQDGVIKVINNGIANINDIDITKLYTYDSVPTSCIYIENVSTGNILDIDINDINIAYGATKGIVMKNDSTGRIRDVVIGANINMTDVAKEYDFSGNVNYISMAASALKLSKSSVAQDLYMPDDFATSIELPSDIAIGTILFNSPDGEYWLGLISTTATSTIVPIQASTNVDVVNTALTGTTGTDGHYTIGIQSRKIYIENRYGSTKRCCISILTGLGSLAS